MTPARFRAEQLLVAVGLSAWGLLVAFRRLLAGCPCGTCR